MDISHLFARVLGPFLMIALSAVWVHRLSFTGVVEDLVCNRAVLFLSGSMALFLGLVIVVLHNSWVMGWPVLITVIGWLAIFKGIIRLFWPDVCSAWMRRMANSAILTYSLITFFILGLYLTFVGYMS